MTDSALSGRNNFSLTPSDHFLRRFASFDSGEVRAEGETMEVKELWATLEQAIKSYTGLSPATFFTFVAVAVAFYYVVSAYFEPAPAPRKRELEAEPVEPLPPPVQLGEISEEELSAYDGSDAKKPLLMAIKGQIYDVTQSRSLSFTAFLVLC